MQWAYLSKWWEMDFNPSIIEQNDRRNPDDILRFSISMKFL